MRAVSLIFPADGRRKGGMSFTHWSSMGAEASIRLPSARSWLPQKEIIALLGLSLRNKAASLVEAGKGVWRERQKGAFRASATCSAREGQAECSSSTPFLCLSAKVRDEFASKGSTRSSL